MAHIEVSNLSKKFSRKNETIEVIENLDLKIEGGDFLCFFGPNGCGKTTLFNILAGIESPDKGEVFVFGKKTSEQDFGFTFQNYSDFLLPWFKARKNIMLPLKLKKLSNEEIETRLEKLTKLLNLNFSLESYTYQLSGGQKQIISILRALLSNGEIILLDEPFSSLDYLVKDKMIALLFKYWQEYKKTIIVITHNLEDAILLGNKLIVFKNRPINNNFLSCDIPTHSREKLFLRTDEFKQIHDKIMDFLAN